MYHRLNDYTDIQIWDLVKEFAIPNIQDILIEKETERELSDFLVSAR